jgi:hypothetical protein
MTQQKEFGEIKEEKKNLDHFSICACHPCAGAMLIFSVSFQFYRMSPKRRSFRLQVSYIYNEKPCFSSVGLNEFASPELRREISLRK